MDRVTRHPKALKESIRAQIELSGAHGVRPIHVSQVRNPHTRDWARGIQCPRVICPSWDQTWFFSWA